MLDAESAPSAMSIWCTRGLAAWRAARRQRAVERSDTDGPKSGATRQFSSQVGAIDPSLFERRGALLQGEWPFPRCRSAFAM